MKKKLTMIIAIAMILTLSLSGCKGSEGGGSKDSKGDATTSIDNEYVTISQYIGLEVPDVEVAEVTDDDVEMQIESELAAYTEQEDVTDRAIEAGDVVDCDYVGTIDGEAFEGGTAEGAIINVTEDDEGFIKGFTTALIGHKTGDKFEADMSFPDDYNSEELAGKACTFTYTVNRVYQEVAAELTDDFVKENIEDYDNVKDYRAHIKEDLEENNKQTADATKQNEVFEAVMDNTEVKKYPEGEVEDWIEEQKKTYQEYADMYGMEFSEFLEQYVGSSEEDFEKELEESGKEAVKQKLIFDAIAEKEDLAITDDEYEEKIEETAKEYGYDSAEDFYEAYDGQVDEEQMRDYFLQDKIIEWLTERAVFTEPKEGEDEESEEETVEDESAVQEDSETEETEESPEEDKGEE